jgi:hypothetical protein
MQQGRRYWEVAAMVTAALELGETSLELGREGKRRKGGEGR